jgi:hypothetical protein
MAGLNPCINDLLDCLFVVFGSDRVELGARSLRLPVASVVDFVLVCCAYT